MKTIILLFDSRINYKGCVVFLVSDHEGGVKADTKLPDYVLRLNLKTDRTLSISSENKIQNVTASNCFIIFI